MCNCEYCIEVNDSMFYPKGDYCGINENLSCEYFNKENCPLYNEEKKKKMKADDEKLFNDIVNYFSTHKDERDKFDLWQRENDSWLNRMTREYVAGCPYDESHERIFKDAVNIFFKEYLQRCDDKINDIDGKLTTWHLKEIANEMGVKSNG